MQIHSLPCNEYNYMVRMCYLWGERTHPHRLARMFFRPYDLPLKINRPMEKILDYSRCPCPPFREKKSFLLFTPDLKKRKQNK